MNLKLGIDTGGTCTDAVLFDSGAQRVLYGAKAPTTREDLTVGILEALDQLPKDMLRQVSSVSLSTTLATNACVEDKGGRAKLILIGGYPKVVREHGQEYGLPDAGEIVFAEGGFDRFGQLEQEVNFDAVMRDAETWAHSVDAVAVVEHNGVANPSNEKEFKRRLQERFQLPVVCGHELFNEYNVLGRAASALLNAKLIVVIRSFLKAIGCSLDARGIQAETVIVRSDGTLMRASFARERPVETILCGPAASVLGGVFLTGERDALLVDMGGTTTDIAVVENGRPIPTSAGVQIGAWRTFVQSVQIDTVGLGGDSLITRDKHGSVTIGPRRAMPLSFAATRWPELKEELRALGENDLFSTHPLNEYLTLVRDISDDTYYTEQERELCRQLRARPLSVDMAAERMHSDYYRFRFDRLEENGVILRAGLTVTDLMHIRGDFTAFDTDTARYGAEFLSRCLKMSVEELCSLCYDRVQQALYRQCVHLLLRLYMPDVYAHGTGEQLNTLIDQSWALARNGKESFFRFGFLTKAVCVSLGAPTHVFLPKVAAALGTRCVIPEHAEVANAVGAAVGLVTARCAVEIKPQYSAAGIDGYTVLGEQTETCETLEDAMFAAEKLARSGAEAEARRRGVTGVLTVRCSEDSKTARLGRGGEEDQELFLGMRVVAMATGTL